MINKTFLVSGVTSGIGLHFLKISEEQGFNLIPIVRAKSDLKNPESYHRVIEFDFSEPWKIDDSFKEFDDEIDAFINFAAILPGVSLLDQSYIDLKHIFEVNLISPMLIINKIHENFKKNGCIILLGSISGHKGSYDDSYAASKGAIHSLVKSLSIKFSPNLRVIGVAPGMIDNTGMTANLIEGLYEKTRKKIPLKTAGKPEEIAELILFLISQTSFVTGAIIDINGGQYLR